MAPSSIHVETATESLEMKGPDNPTRQLLPIMSTKCCSRDGEGRKDKGGGGVEDREVKQSSV
jgi:hypothetical protein